MDESNKSPFRLWADTEVGDSQKSFNLPSPELVEKSGASTPELYTIEFDQYGQTMIRDPSFSLDCQDQYTVQQPANYCSSALKSLGSPKFSGSSVFNNRGITVGTDTVVQSPKDLLGKQLRKRGLSPSYELYRQHRMKRQAKPEPVRPRPLPDIHKETLEEAKSMPLAHGTFGFEKVKMSPSAVAYGLNFVSPKFQKQSRQSPKHFAFQSPESPKTLTRQRRNSPLKSPVGLLKAKKTLELVSHQFAEIPRVKVAISPHPPCNPYSKSPISKVHRSLTPHDRSGFRHV